MPLFREPQPDDRPSRNEVLFAAFCFVAVIAAIFILGILKEVQP